MRNRLPALFFIFFVVGLCVAIALRVTLVRSFTDPVTGFYIGKYATLTPILTIVTIVCALILLVPLFFPEKVLSPAPLSDKNAPLGTLAALSALALLVLSLSLFFSLVTTSTSGGLFLDALFTLAAAVYFGLQAKAFFMVVRTPNAWFALLPVLWATVHLIVSWMRFTTVVNISANLFDLLKMVAFMLFFYYHARLFGGVSNGREHRGLLSFGLLATFFGLLSAVPPLWVRLTGGRVGAFQLPDAIATLVLSVYILVLLVQLFLRRPTEKPEKVRPAV